MHPSMRTPYRKNVRLETPTSPAMKPWIVFILGWVFLAGCAAGGWNAPILPNTASTVNGCPQGSTASHGACRYLDWGPTEHSSQDASEEMGRLAQ